MIKNYFVLTYRNFLRNKNYTLVNVLGLSVGITSCIIIFLMITDDLSFDKFHSKYNTIYRVVREVNSPSGSNRDSATPYPFTRAFRNDFSGILATQVHNQFEALLSIGTEKSKVKNILFADSLFFDVFDFTVLSGNPKVELGQPGKVFLTKSLADKILKGAEKGTIKLSNKIELDVVGIVADPPPASHISFSMIVSMPSLTGEFAFGFPADFGQWGLVARSYSYVVLPKNNSPAGITERLKPFAKKYHSEEEGARTTYMLQPLSEIHFDSRYTKQPGTAAIAETSDLVVMAVLGLFILVMACINFINLATALAIKKSREIGIRKTLGANRSQLTIYFLGETFLLTVFSVLLSLCATEWLLAWLNQFLEKQITIDLFSNPLLIVFLVGLILFVTILSGTYPGLILSAYNPIVVLKNKMGAQGSAGYLRKALVVFQLLIAQGLIIGTLIVANQMKYFRNKPLGFDKEAIINVPLPNNRKEVTESFRTRLESNSNIKHVTMSVGAPTSDNDFYTDFFLSEKGRDAGAYSIGIKPVDHHYFGTYDIKLIAGRTFTIADESLVDMDLPDKEKKFVYIINESAVKQLGFATPQEIIGKSITTGLNAIEGEVIGVVQDFHIVSLHKEIIPVVFVPFPELYYEAGIKVNAGNLNESIRFIEKNWKELFPESYFEYEFLDQHLAKLYQQEEKTFTLLKILAGISIFIGCLGLYGLISFMISNKLKEVGIRKVMGASASGIVVLFSREFVKLIVIAFVVAVPLTWYFMNQWLESFAYRTAIHWSVFLIGIVSTLFIALITIGYQSMRAAMTNPVETLRSE